MFKVAGAWELGYDTPIKEHDLWAYGLDDFGCDEWFMWPVSGIRSSKVKEYETVEEIIEANPDCTPILVHENGEVESKDFEHPENPLYILGKASWDPGSHLNSRYKNVKSVRIDTPKSTGGLWGHQAIFLLLRDKQWQSQ